MSTAATEDATAVRLVTTPLVSQYLLAQLGTYSVLPVLPVLLTRVDGDLSPWAIGAALFGFNGAIRGASLFCSRPLHRARVRQSMCAGLLVAAVGFALLPVAPGPAGVVACLLVAGTGLSINGLMTRVYVALRLTTSAARNTAFSAVQTVANVAAAVGPIIGSLLLGDRYATVLLLLVAGLFAAAALVAFLMVPADLRQNDGTVRPPLTLGIFRAIVSDPTILRVSVVVAVGLFLYGQFFSAVSLHLTQLTSSSAVRAAAFTMNAVLVVVLLIPVSAFARRKLTAGVTPFTFLRAGVGLFAVAFAAMALIGSTVVGAYVAIVLFSVAESVISPMISTAFGDLPGDRPAVEVFNMRQVATTTGESLGSFAGSALFLTASAHNLGAWYWTALALFGGIVVLAYARRGADPERPADS